MPAQASNSRAGARTTGLQAWTLMFNSQIRTAREQLLPAEWAALVPVLVENAAREAAALANYDELGQAT